MTCTTLTLVMTTCGSPELANESESVVWMPPVHDVAPISSLHRCTARTDWPAGAEIHAIAAVPSGVALMS